MSKSTIMRSHEFTTKSRMTSRGMPPKLGSCHPDHHWYVQLWIVLRVTKKNLHVSNCRPFEFSFCFWIKFLDVFFCLGNNCGVTFKSRSKNTTHEKQINFIGGVSLEKDDGFWMHWDFWSKKNIISVFGAPFRGVSQRCCFWLSLPSVRVDEFP